MKNSLTGKIIAQKSEGGYKKMSSGYVLSDEVLDHKINEPAYPKKSSYKAERSLNDLDLFTKGQPVDFYKELRDNAPVYFHDPMPTDPEPGYWVLTRHEDIKHVSMLSLIHISEPTRRS